MALRTWTRVTGTVNGNARYSGGFEWQVTNSDADRIANNRSVLLVRMWGANSQPQNGAWNLTDLTSFIKIDGIQYNQTTRYDWRNASANVKYYVGLDTVVFPKGSYKEVTIYHNADGTKSVPVEVFFNGDVPSFLNMTASATITLPPIPRASTPTASNGTIGSALTINTNRVSTNFTHTLKATFGGVTDTIATGVGASYTWTPALSLQSRIPNATSGSCVITCETYNGAALIGTKTVTITLSINTASCTPTLSGSYTDLNTAITAITGSATLLVSGLSNVQVTAIPSLKYGATISSIKIGGVSVAAGGAPYRRVVNAVTVASYLLEVTDSRGLSATATVTLSYAPYENITFMASFFRTAAMNNEIALQFSGTFYNNNIGTTTNELTVRYRSQPELGEWSEWVTVEDVTIDGNNFENTGVHFVLPGSFDHNKQYRFEIEFIDSLDVKTNTVLVRAGRHILKVTETVQVLQGKLHIQKLYTKEDKDFVFDFVYDIITRTWLVHVYGLTQMFEPQHVFQADVNARSIITVLNQEGYPLLKYTIDDTANNFVDHINVDEPAPFNNHTMVDTGICPLPEILEKRARELQFTTFNTGAETLEFFVTAYIDSRNVSNPDVTTIDWITDPEDPDYGKLYVVEEEIANVYGETNLDSWTIDMSRFPKTGLVKSHLRLHGKGLYFRAIIVNRDMIEHELSGITWVYRIMNAR